MESPEQSPMLEDLRQLDRVCDEFEQAWRSGSSPPQLEAYLAQAPEAAADKANWFEELLQLELHYLLRSGETIDSELYRRRFPDQADIVRKVFGEPAASDNAPPGAKAEADPPASTARSNQVDVRTGQADARTGQADARTGQADARTGQARQPKRDPEMNRDPHSERDRQSKYDRPPRHTTNQGERPAGQGPAGAGIDVSTVVYDADAYADADAGGRGSGNAASGGTAGPGDSTAGGSPQRRGTGPLDDTSPSKADTDFHRALERAFPKGSTDNVEDPTVILDGTAVRKAMAGGTLPSIPDYEILDIVGRGGMGVVFRARQISLNRTVAVKMILSGRLAEPEEIRRFRGEAQAAAALRHPNIVAIHEVREHAGQHYFTMDYVPGCSLQQRIQTRPLPPDEAAACVERIARAIDYAHGQGILHRDLKPANVLIDAHGSPLVTDFGLAKRMFDDQSLTATDQFLGTLCYAPPEQASGQKEQIGPAADIYSLGAILYELLTGKPPFKAATFADTLSQVLNDPPAPPRVLNAKVPKDLETICLKCLAKQPRDRYATAGELADDLARFARGEPVKARRISPWGKFWRWCKRKPGVAALLLMLMIAAAAVTLAVILASRANHAQQLRDLTTQFETALDAVRFDRDYLAHMEQLLDDWHQLAPEEAAAQRTRFYGQFADSIRRGIYRERLDDAEAQELRQAIAALSDREGKAAKLGQNLEEELAARLSRPESLFVLAAPFDELEGVFAPELRVRVAGEQLIPDSSKWPESLPDLALATTHRCEGNVELLAEFAPGWQAQPRLGLVLGQPTDNGTVQGYEFVVRNENKAAGQSASPEAMLINTHHSTDGAPLAMPGAGYCWLEIFYDGALLQQQRIDAAQLSAGRLVLRASRRNYQLAFQVNGLPELRFQETFPPAQLGTFGVRWPRGQGLLSLSAKRVGAPPQSSPLQRGDDLFNQGAHRAALAFYEQQARISSDAAIRQEADYKRALCHRRLQQDPLAEEILQQLMREPGGTRWPFMAACEAWAMLLEAGRMDEAEEVYGLIEARFSFAQLAVNVPGHIRRRILDTYSIHLSPLDVFRSNPNRIRDALRALQLQRLFQNAVDEGQEKFVLMGIHRYDGDLERALQLAQELADWGEANNSPMVDLYAYAWCRLLRLTRPPQQALEVLNSRYGEPRFLQWQRLERAKAHVALGDETAAEADLRELVEVAGDGRNRETFVSGCLMLGAVLRRQGQLEEADRTWRQALATVRQEPAPGSYQMVCAHIIGSQLGEWTEEDNRRFFQTVLPRRTAGPLFNMLRDRLIDTPATLPAMQDLWRLRVAEPWLEPFIFDQVPMPNRVRVPFQLLGVAYLKHTAFGGELSAEQEQAIWQLAEQIVQEAVQRGYDHPDLHAELTPYLSSWLIGLPASPLVVEQLSEPLRGGLGYALAHRFIRRGDAKTARQMLQHTVQNAQPDSPVKPLAALDLELIEQNEGVLLVPEQPDLQGGALIVRQGNQTVAEVAIAGAVQHRLKTGSYEAEIRRADQTSAAKRSLQVRLAGHHTISAKH